MAAAAAIPVESKANDKPTPNESMLVAIERMSRVLTAR